MQMLLEALPGPGIGIHSVPDAHNRVRLSVPNGPDFLNSKILQELFFASGESVDFDLNLNLINFDRKLGAFSRQVSLEDDAAFKVLQLQAQECQKVLNNELIPCIDAMVVTVARCLGELDPVTQQNLLTAIEYKVQNQLRTNEEFRFQKKAPKRAGAHAGLGPSISNLDTLLTRLKPASRHDFMKSFNQKFGQREQPKKSPSKSSTNDDYLYADSGFDERHYVDQDPSDKEYSNLEYSDLEYSDLGEDHLSFCSAKLKDPFDFQIGQIPQEDSPPPQPECDVMAFIKNALFGRKTQKEIVSSLKSLVAELSPPQNEIHSIRFSPQRLAKLEFGSLFFGIFGPKSQKTFERGLSSFLKFLQNMSTVATGSGAAGSGAAGSGAAGSGAAGSGAVDAQDSKVLAEIMVILNPLIENWVKASLTVTSDTGLLPLGEAIATFKKRVLEMERISNAIDSAVTDFRFEDFVSLNIIRELKQSCQRLGHLTKALNSDSGAGLQALTKLDLAIHSRINASKIQNNSGTSVSQTHQLAVQEFTDFFQKNPFLSLYICGFVGFTDKVGIFADRGSTELPCVALGGLSVSYFVAQKFGASPD